MNGEFINGRARRIRRSGIWKRRNIGDGDNGGVIGLVTGLLCRSGRSSVILGSRSILGKNGWNFVMDRSWRNDIVIGNHLDGKIGKTATKAIRAIRPATFIGIHGECEGGSGWGSVTLINQVLAMEVTVPAIDDWRTAGS